MVAQRLGDFFHGFDARTHDKHSPFVKEFSGPGRRVVIMEWVVAAVDGGEGPLLHGYSSESEQRSFDSTCKKLYRFLITF